MLQLIGLNFDLIQQIMVLSNKRKFKNNYFSYQTLILLNNILKIKQKSLKNVIYYQNEIRFICRSIRICELKKIETNYNNKGKLNSKYFFTFFIGFLSGLYQQTYNTR